MRRGYNCFETEKHLFNLSSYFSRNSALTLILSIKKFNFNFFKILKYYENLTFSNSFSDTDNYF